MGKCNEKKQINFKYMMIYIISFIFLLYCFVMTMNPILLVLMITSGILTVYYCLKYFKEKIIILNTGIKYTNLFGIERMFSWENLSIKKQKRHYRKNTNSKSMYYRRYEIKYEYILFTKGIKLFKISEDELISTSKENLDLAIKNKKIKQEKTIIDGEEVVLLKTSSMPLLLNLFMFVFLFLMITIIYIGLFSGFNVWILIFNAVFTIIDIYYLICVIKNIMQIVQKVYFIENQGFYKVLLKNKEYYDFKDIDECVAKKYFCIEPVEYKLSLYKENKKVLTLTNSSAGFYDFLDEVRSK